MRRNGWTERGTRLGNIQTLRRLSIIGNVPLIEAAESQSLARSYNRWPPGYGKDYLNTRISNLQSSPRAGSLALKLVTILRDGRSTERLQELIKNRWRKI